MTTGLAHGLLQKPICLGVQALSPNRVGPMIGISRRKMIKMIALQANTISASSKSSPPSDEPSELMMVENGRAFPVALKPDQGQRGETLVRGAARLAAAAGVPPLIIGLTVVAIGTSSPEIAVMAQAGSAGSSN